MAFALQDKKTHFLTLRSESHLLPPPAVGFVASPHINTFLNSHNVLSNYIIDSWGRRCKSSMLWTASFSLLIIKVYFSFWKFKMCLGWCGSVDWVLACEPKGCQFDSQSGDMLGLWARSSVEGAQEAAVRVGGGYLPRNLSPPLILSKMSEYQDGWGNIPLAT